MSLITCNVIIFLENLSGILFVVLEPNYQFQHVTTPIQM